MGIKASPQFVTNVFFTNLSLSLRFLRNLLYERNKSRRSKSLLRHFSFFISIAPGKYIRMEYKHNSMSSTLSFEEGFDLVSEGGLNIDLFKTQVHEQLDLDGAVGTVTVV